MKPENESPAIISSHAYVSSPFKPWGVCAVCGFAEAAHERSNHTYLPGSDLRFRCPDCVTKNISPCVHGPNGERE